MSKHKTEISYLFFPIGVDVCFTEATTSTVALIATDAPIAFTDSYIAKSVTTLLNSGCTFFMTWGDSGRLIEDVIDAHIEDHPELGFEAVTTCHTGETVDDVVDFMLHATFPGAESLSCVLIYDATSKQIIELVEAVKSKA